MSTYPSNHSECFLDDWCNGSDCPIWAPKHRREAARARRWDGVFMPPKRDGQGHASYYHLQGQPLSCSSTIELQAIEREADDYGEYTRYLDRGVAVTYELAWRGAGRVPVLHADVAGHRAVITVEPWMRFRWPAVSRG